MCYLKCDYKKYIFTILIQFAIMRFRKYTLSTSRFVRVKSMTKVYPVINKWVKIATSGTTK